MKSSDTKPPHSGRNQSSWSGFLWAQSRLWHGINSKSEMKYLNLNDSEKSRWRPQGQHTCVVVKVKGNLFSYLEVLEKVELIVYYFFDLTLVVGVMGYFVFHYGTWSYLTNKQHGSVLLGLSSFLIIKLK